MDLRRRLVRSVVVMVVVSPVIVGCGLRSDPLAQEDAGATVEPDGPGTCEDPLAITSFDQPVIGALSTEEEAGELQGSCDGAGGPEDVYRLESTADQELSIVFDANATQFSPSLRVMEGEGCDIGAADEVACVSSAVGEHVHFFARAGRTYTLVVDSAAAPEPEANAYAFTVATGDPPLSACPVHQEVIEQAIGVTFVWTNDLAGGLGRVDGQCGGPGRENMFPLQVGFVGVVRATVTGSGGFIPAVDIRTGCGAGTELLCAGEAGNASAVIEWAANEPGLYYLVVDQVGSDGGFYELRVEFF